MKPEPAPGLRRLAAYQVPRPPVPIDLRLDGNEGLAPEQASFDALRAAGTEVLRRYPDARPLEARLAERHGVSPEQVLVAAGADEALDRLLRGFTWSEREIVLPWPSFVMIPHYAALSGARVVHVPWARGPYPRREVLAAIGPATALVFCVSPNNPTGAVATKADLAALAAGAPNALVVLDHAYAEFADEDLTAFALGFPNALVLRTFSKARGLAGLRVGYALGPAEIVRVLRAAGGPYAVAGPSLALAAGALAAADPREAEYVEAVRRERVELAAHLARLGAAADPSQGNFVLGRFGDAELVRDLLAGLGILVRLFPGEPALAGALRITCPGDAAEFARLIAAFEAVLRPQALLFDLDGVLLDVHASGARPLVAPAAVAALRAELPLGVVTGMRRAEAARLLEGAGLSALVSVLVSAEDAAPKPSPAGPRLALERLGARSAWMVGDQPQDAAAARAAGVVPLGLLPPRGQAADADGRKEHGLRLHAAGAARVLERLDELAPLLSRARSAPAPLYPIHP